MSMTKVSTYDWTVLRRYSFDERARWRYDFVLVLTVHDDVSLTEALFDSLIKNLCFTPT